MRNLTVLSPDSPESKIDLTKDLAWIWTLDSGLSISIYR